MTAAIYGAKVYTYNELAGYGFIPGNARDKFGDTIGGIGSAIAMKSWKKTGNSYQGTLFVQSDRGWNTNGTINFIPRVHKFTIKFDAYARCDCIQAIRTKRGLQSTRAPSC